MNKLLSTWRGARYGVTPKWAWKVIKIQASLQGNKNNENWSQGYPKSWKMQPGIMGNPTSVKFHFCNISHAKCLVFQSQTSRFKSKKASEKETWKQASQNTLFLIQSPKKLSKGVRKSSQKQWKSVPGPQIKVSFLVLPSVPASSHDLPGRQSGGPKHPKWQGWALNL